MFGWIIYNKEDEENLKKPESGALIIALYQKYVMTRQEVICM